MLGDADGLALGDRDGLWEGLDDGDALGDSEGNTDGLVLGDRDGSSLGWQSLRSRLRQPRSKALKLPGQHTDATRASMPDQSDRELT